MSYALWNRVFVTGTILDSYGGKLLVILITRECPNGFGLIGQNSHMCSFLVHAPGGSSILLDITMVLYTVVQIYNQYWHNRKPVEFHFLAVRRRSAEFMLRYCHNQCKVEFIIGTIIMYQQHSRPLWEISIP